MSLSLQPATGRYLDQILGDTFPLWNDDLNPTAYAQFWRAQTMTPWGRDHLDRVALVDNDSVIASAKRYRLEMRLDGTSMRVLGIGAVFTTPSRRSEGAASELLARIVDQAIEEGYDAAALFSEIDQRFYARLGFQPVPNLESRLQVRIKPGAPAMLVRAGDDRDLPAIAALNAKQADRARLSLVRSDQFIQFGISKRRLLAGLGPSQLRTIDFLVVEEGYTAVAYLVGLRYDRVWFIEDAGDRDPAGARLGAMLQAMLARVPAAETPEIRAWWPPGLQPPQVDIIESRPVKEVLMIHPLRADRVALEALATIEARDVAIARLDYF